MKDENWILGALALVALWWFWMQKKMVKPTSAQSACGCNNPKTAISSTTGINPTVGAGSTALLSGKPGVQAPAGPLTPSPAPGNTLAPVTPLSPPQAPFVPSIPVGSSVWVANTRPRAVKA